MNYYTDLFSPETYVAFGRSAKDVSGFRVQQQASARRLEVGDRLICYMTKLSRWIGVLQVASPCYVDNTPLFYPADDPFVVRFKVQPIVWLPKEKAIPIHEPIVWDQLSFTKGTDASAYGWTGMLRRSLNRLSGEDGCLLERLLAGQASGGQEYPVDEEIFEQLVAQRVRRENKFVAVTVPADKEEVEAEPPVRQQVLRESAKMQALLAVIGEKMGFNIWLPKSDRTLVLQEWTPGPGTLLEVLPLNYDLTTLQTIEQIDVLWLKKRAIARAFEVEHTTAVYSGLLRMADLLALQPNMDIKLHIVAPPARREKVLSEIRRPVFSLLDKGPLAESCSFISYDSVLEIADLPHLVHLSDSVLEEYCEEADQ